MKGLSTLTFLLLASVAMTAPHAATLPEATASNAEELFAAMAAVNAGDERIIRLASSNIPIPPDNSGSGVCKYAGYTAIPELPIVTGRITIVGNGGTLLGEAGARLPFCIDHGGELILEDVTIRGFGTDPDTARFPVALAVNSGLFRLLDVVVRDNGVDTLPGASRTVVVNRQAGTLEATNTVFTGNVAAYRYGYSHILLSQGDLVLRNSAFTDNRMPAISVPNQPGKATVLQSDGLLDMLNVTVSGNSHGVVVRGRESVIEHATIVGNDVGVDFQTTEAPVVRNSIIASNPEGDCRFRVDVESVTFQGVNLDGDGSCGLDPERDLPATNPRLMALRSLSSGLPGHVPRPGSPVLDRGDPDFCPLRDAGGRIRDTADDDKRCALGAVERWNADPFEIDARLTGTYYDPEHDGHYVSFQVLPIDLVAAVWWTYDSQGNPLWLIGSGEVDGDTARIEVFSSRGMALPSLDDDQREQKRWGTLELRFNNCHSLDMRWTTDRPNFSDGETELQRLTFNEGLEC